VAGIVVAATEFPLIDAGYKGQRVGGMHLLLSQRYACYLFHQPVVTASQYVLGLDRQLNGMKHQGLQCLGKTLAIQSVL
jgi:hypothetical protein